MRQTLGTLGTVSAAFLLWGAAPLSAQSELINFFVAVEGATWGADQGAVQVSDDQCGQLAYAQGYGHLTWRAYLNGTETDGEADEVARERIGGGPWYNYYGVMIAEDLDQLHSDENNLWAETAVTVVGDYPPEGALEIPWGSELDGSLFDRSGPFFCFGV